MLKTTVVSMAVMGLLSGGCGPQGGRVESSSAANSGSEGSGVALALESLGEAETFDDLERYGLVAPGASNHKAGSELVLLALKVTALGNGPWAMAHGLLGATMVDADVMEKHGYRSLFASLALGEGKLYASLRTNDNIALLLNPLTDHPRETQSLVAKREAVLCAIAYQLEARYIYDDIGNFARNYAAMPYPKTNRRLADILGLGMTVFKELSVQGFQDGTLRDALGIAHASLGRDAFDRGSAFFELGPEQVYRDALDATLERLGSRRQHSLDVIEELCLQMEARGLSVRDEMLLPSDQESLDSLLSVVSADLHAISRHKS